MNNVADPTFGAVTSAAATLGSAVVGRYHPAGQSRVGGREERRRVYTRFQEAVIAYVMQIRDSRISPEAIGLEPSARKPYIDALIAATTEMAQALYEVRLVGNPGTIDAAENVRDAISRSFDAAAIERRSLTSAEVRAYVNAMNEFTSACRIDLWYQPRWWQLWRVGWWKMRLTRGAKERGVAATSQQTAIGVKAGTSAAQGNSSAPKDVVFGTSNPGGTYDRLVVSESLSNALDALSIENVLPNSANVETNPRAEKGQRRRTRRRGPRLT
jgi:hypothetical protein